MRSDADAEPPDGEAEAPDVGVPADAAALAQVLAEPERQDARVLLSSVPGRLEQLERASHPAKAPPMALRLYVPTADRIVLARRTDFVARISALRRQRLLR